MVSSKKDGLKPKKDKKAKLSFKETKAEQALRVERILEALDREYGTDYRCYLEHETAYELLFSTIMSAQCTDERVNKVTRVLYKKYPDLKSFADADLEELKQDIYQTGFYNNKAKNIIACAKVLLEKYGGEVPSDIDELIKLPGVGRKTANVIRGNIYDIPSIVVDTHVKRISNKLGLVHSDDPVKIEFELMDILPKDHWILWNIDIITLGRSICTAQRPDCQNCFLRGLCPSAAL
ncbi:MAG TPA: endonuclease III [Candidatus Avilachnospira avistercoris]|nr:endonuclease III [Candidatus Avilachnospira avistercoris]